MVFDFLQERPIASIWVFRPIQPKTHSIWTPSYHYDPPRLVNRPIQDPLKLLRPKTPLPRHFRAMETWVLTKPVETVMRMVRPMMRTMRVGARRRREKEKETEKREKKWEKRRATRDKREKINKIINWRVIVTMYICTVNIVIVHKCTILHLLMWVFFFFFVNMCKMGTFFYFRRLYTCWCNCSKSISILFIECFI